MKSSSSRSFTRWHTLLLKISKSGRGSIESVRSSSMETFRIKDLFVKKKIDLSAVCSGVHTSWASSEQLVRGMYFGCLEAKEKYGISPKCAFYVDLSGVSWSAVNCFTKMGIKYIGILANGFRNSSPNTNIPPLFWWEDFSGNERVLLWNQRSYRQHGLDGIWCVYIFLITTINNRGRLHALLFYNKYFLQITSVIIKTYFS